MHIRAPRTLINPETATTSTLYFTHRRPTRRTDDLSHGWGSHSQWATAFPRFYQDDQGLHFNHDGEHDLTTESTDPATEQRRELLLYRCFVRDLPADEGDRFPYSDRLTLAAPLSPSSRP
ncbi:hypothetical protein BLA60_38850 [Actinophytocola xinjiangensis]|uniref:Uncharacterized protein n=1 Tax=Actinophytocola xinjiangensis TaxID=485602 RepID=A0A7Z0WDF9_9PSEU|nr:hypothetical protein BLA60_38850 [Actinophytocola xinjiangensis]